jgi:hypothetical protein
MNGLTNATRTLVRSMIIAAGVAALVLSASQRVGAEENTGYGADVATGVQLSVCLAGGGEKLEVDTTRTPGSGLVGVKATCKGGSMDGWTCLHDRQTSLCKTPQSHQEEPPTTSDNAAEPTGGVEAESELSVLTANVEAHVVDPAEEIESEPETTAPPTEATDEGAAPAGEGEVVEATPAVDEGADDGVEDEDGGHDLPETPAQDETTAPTEGDPAADPGTGEGGEEVTGADEVVAPTGAAEEPVAEEPAADEPAADGSGGTAEGGVAGDGVAEDGVSEEGTNAGESEDQAGTGQEVPETPAQDETTAAEGDPTADPGAGESSPEGSETYAVAGGYAGIGFVVMDDEQA